LALLSDESHSIRSSHAEIRQNRSRHKRGTIVAHAAMGEDSISFLDQLGAETSDVLQLREIGQIAIFKGKVDVKQLVGYGGHTHIEIVIHVKDDLNTMSGHHIPIVDIRRDEKSALLIDRKNFHRALIPYL
jgi:hypothetical protein